MHEPVFRRRPPMTRPRILGVIPARIGSTRLPAKPLRPLLGTPLVLWSWRRAREMDFIDRLVVATDCEEVARVCRDDGAEAEMTAADHPSGSDRVWEVARRSSPAFEIVINLQGDEPLLDAASVRAAVAMVERGFDVGSCAAPIASAADFRDPSVVKVVRARDGGALYFSRAPIPFRQAPPSPSGPAAVRPLHHVGIYAYRRDALRRWVAFGPSGLEREERLEQLRALENGMRIGMALVPAAPPGVDTPADLARLERRLKGAGAGK